MATIRPGTRQQVLFGSQQQPAQPPRADTPWKPELVCEYDSTAMGNDQDVDVVGMFRAHVVDHTRERRVCGPYALTEELAVIGLLARLRESKKPHELSEYRYTPPTHVPPHRVKSWVTLAKPV